MHVTSTPIDQKIAEEVKSHSGMGGTVRFQQIIKGWSGSGFDSSWRMAEATFFESAQCATLSFDCVNTKNNRNLKGGLGSLALDRASAIKLARAMVPQEIAAAIDAAVLAASSGADEAALKVARMILTDAVEGSGIAYWAHGDDVQREDDSPNYVTSLTVSDAGPDGEPVKTESMILTPAAILKARDLLVSGEVPVRRDIAAQFVGKPNSWEYDGDGVDAIVQAAYFGKIVYG